MSSNNLGCDVTTIELLKGLVKRMKRRKQKHLKQISHPDAVSTVKARVVCAYLFNAC